VLDVEEAAVLAAVDDLIEGILFPGIAFVERGVFRVKERVLLEGDCKRKGGRGW
jgi:hypothetical protein